MASQDVNLILSGSFQVSPWIVIVVSAATANVKMLVARPRSASRSRPGARDASRRRDGLGWAQLQTRAAAPLPIGGEPAVDRDELRGLLPVPGQ